MAGVPIPNWVALAKKADGIIDDLFGEKVNLRPWKVNPYSDSAPDLTRPVVENAVGVPMDKVATPAMAAPGQVGKSLESDLIISMRHEYLDACDLCQGDRVEFLWRQETYEVTFVDEQTDDRHYVHLLGIKE